MSPGSLRKMAERSRRHAAKLEADLAVLVAEYRQRIDTCHRQEAQFLLMADDAEKVPGSMRTTDLHTRSQKATLSDVNDTARLNMSRSNSSDPFVKACRAKSLTQNDVAKKVGVPRSLLSMYRSGVRKIPQDRADAIETLIGWKADAKHWPGGILASD